MYSPWPPLSRTLVIKTWYDIYGLPNNHVHFCAICWFVGHMTSSLDAASFYIPLITSGFSSRRACDVDIDDFFVDGVNELLNKQSSNRSFQTPWSYFDITVILSAAPRCHTSDHITSFTLSILVADIGRKWSHFIMASKWQFLPPLPDFCPPNCIPQYYMNRTTSKSYLFTNSIFFVSGTGKII